MTGTRPGKKLKRRALRAPTHDFALWYAERLTEKFAWENGWSANQFSVTPGTKYDKVWQCAKGGDASKSIHCFVDKSGQVFKAATWRAPAPHVRYPDVMSALAASDLYGSYLYMK